MMTECKSILYSIYSVSVKRNGRNTAKQNATSYSVLLTSLTIKLVMCLLVSTLKLGEASASLLNLHYSSFPMLLNHLFMI